jgi:Zn-dependent membrane protease YugP
MFFYIDPVYFWYVLIPVLVISIGVQVYLKSTFNKWSGVENSNHLTGMETARALFDRTSLKAIPLERVAGSMSDHFDPGQNVVRLSDTVAGVKSVAAMAVAAHELGHVQQYQTGSGLIKARGFLLPALQFSPTISYLCILFGFWFNATNLIWVGIFFFSLMVLFSLLTLPVEIDASRRGLALLREAGLTKAQEDAKGARQVLTAAGLTYLAAAVTSILQLLYYISVAQRRG